ncbi:Hypothetical_protein [Hexamita inflata]|uniref:Hypothetical_protein n=1 Tax=Hexamita inflata TaxID=28002 RepID=A0AA86UGZ1_9EUKA|nr:Hypothetical protein HINF_LOCUS27585 [Hexamita inflata]CAI9939943.1 Hypothetical protein HINF_LOCUS27588 [Hexamita inflata]
MGKGGHSHSHSHSHSHGHSHGHAHSSGHHHSTVSHSKSYHPTYHKSTSHTTHKTSHHSYSGGTRRGIEDPLTTFNNPSCMRKTSWAIICVMCVGLSFIIAFAVHPESYLIGLISFGSIILVYSSIFAIVTAIKCCSVGSLRYFMCPCFMSSFEIDQLKSKCQAKHDLIFGTTQVAQTGVGFVLDVVNQNNENQFANQEQNDREEQQEEVKQPIQAEEYKPQNVQTELVFSAVM